MPFSVPCPQGPSRLPKPNGTKKLEPEPAILTEGRLVFARVVIGTQHTIGNRNRDEDAERTGADPLCAAGVVNGTDESHGNDREERDVIETDAVLCRINDVEVEVEVEAHVAMNLGMLYIKNVCMYVLETPCESDTNCCMDVIFI